MKIAKFPTISIAIPAYNEEENIGKCLESVFRQGYPKDKLEVFVIDNYSDDKTVEVAKQFSVKIIYNKVKDAQHGKMLAFRRAKGEFFIYLDADVRLRGKDWFSKMIKPLKENPNIVGSFTRYYKSTEDSWLTRYLNHDPFQRDPVFIFLTPSVESTIIEKRKDYFICKYLSDKIVPEGRCLYKKEILEKTIIGRREKFMELDNLAILVKTGHNQFAYVPKAGFYHPFLRNITHLLKKRIRNIKRNFLFQEEQRYYTWIDFRNPVHLAKISVWIVYSTLILPSLIVGIFKTIKHKDAYCLIEPILNFVETYIIIFTFISLFLLKSYKRFLASWKT